MRSDFSPSAPTPRPFRVSALISTYKGEKFIRGCLEDLIAQTIFVTGDLQIVIINSNSPEDEDAIIREFIHQHPTQFVYIHTPQRETLYAAWNRALRAATAPTLTNANVDDRHHPQALEKMAAFLDSHPEIALVYADTYVTAEENIPWQKVKQKKLRTWPDFNRDLLFEHPYIGQAPLWRRSLHDQLGEFDADMKSAGDYEFWLRAAQHHHFHHLPEPLGLYLERPDALSLGNIDLTWHEGEIARDRHWNPKDGPHPKHRHAQPHFAALKRRIAQLPSGARVALFGAGKHTVRMFPLFRDSVEPHAKLVGILDDAPAAPHLALSAGMKDLPILPTQQWRNLTPQVVIVSSDTYENAMYTSLRATLPESIDVWRLYQTTPHPVAVGPEEVPA